ncbi:MAG: GNAT family N-acetyltransferase [Candidatus Thorarchaeota archaeon]
MSKDDVKIVAYLKDHARSIAEHLFEGVPEDVVLSQRDELLKPGPNEVFSVCAVSGSEVVGVCTGVRMRWFGSRHRIELVQVVVREGFRGLGIARKMMKTIASHFSTRGVEIVQISVDSSNTEAFAAYERIGFERFGFLKEGIKHNGKYGDEIFLASPISKILSIKSS